MIAFHGITKPSKEGWEGIPDEPQPFFVGARDGLWLHRRMLIGRGMIKLERWPEHFEKFGYDDRAFFFDADPVPAQIMGQIVNFFERTYDRQHTEAAVLLVMHAETHEWRVFVPTQLVSHGGVNYVFDPSHIRYPWIIVGSIHSHCNFGAGHSGTDTNDADGFDGLHCTIGQIKSETPQIVAMVAMNKKLIHYPPDLFPKLFDFSEVRQHKAPEWWDRYVEDTINKVKPVGFELYKKFDKPTVVKTESTGTLRKVSPPSPGYKPTGFNTNEWVWSEELRRMVRVIPEEHKKIIKDFYAAMDMDAPPKGYETVLPQVMINQGFVWNREQKTWRWERTTRPETSHGPILSESRAFNRSNGIAPLTDDEDDMLEDMIRARYGIPGDRDSMRTVHDEDETDEPNDWSERLDDQIVTAIYGRGSVTDADEDWAFDNPDEAGTIEGWRHRLMMKMLDMQEVLELLGLKVVFNVSRVPTIDESLVEVFVTDEDGQQIALLTEGKPQQTEFKGVN